MNSYKVSRNDSMNLAWMDFI